MDTDLTEQLADAWLRLQMAHIGVEGTDKTSRRYRNLLDELMDALRSYYRVIECMDREAKQKA